MVFENEDFFVTSEESSPSFTTQESVEAAVTTGAEPGQEGPEQEGTRFEHIKEALELLYTYFPQCFIKEGDCKPLKVGIFDDVRSRLGDKPGLTVSKVRAAMRFYTGRLRYLYSLQAGAKRVDLDGNEGEEVSAEHAAFAAERAASIRAKLKERKQTKLASQGDENSAVSENASKSGGARRQPFPQNKADKRRSLPSGRRASPKVVRRQPAQTEQVAPLPSLELEEISPGAATRGMTVFVLTGQGESYVRGQIEGDENKGVVLVLLDSGMSLQVPLERLRVERKPG